MNRSSIQTVSVALLLGITLGGITVASPCPSLLPTANAQEAAPPTAEVVAARVQAFYEQTRTVETAFQQHFWNRAYARTQSSRGTLTIQRPGRIRFDYAEPRGKVVVSTPAGYVFYEPGDDGSPGQLLRGSTDGASSALGFLAGTADLARDFRLSLRAPGGAAAPAHTNALELRPRRPSPYFRRIVLYVDDRPDTLGVVRRVSIEDPDGNWNRFDFTGPPRFNREVSASTFEYQPPAGARDITPAGAREPSPAGAAAPRPAPGASIGPLPGPGSSG